MLNGVQHPLLWEPYKKETPPSGGVWLYAGYRMGCCCFATQKRRDGGLSKEYQLRNMRSSYTMEAVQNKRFGRSIV
jgi:hypothetical protein